MIEFSEKYWIYGLGFFSQGLFAIRLLIQWFLSEKQGKVVSPLIFWQISVFAAYLFMVYGILQNDLVIILGQAMAYVIYIRNLQLEGAWQQMPAAFRISAILFPILTLIWMIDRQAGQAVDFHFDQFLHPLVMMGSIGQLLLNFRFAYQWYYAERTKTSDLPLGFWLMTALGSILTVIYAVGRFDPVLLFAQGLGFVASLRNIQLHYKAKEAN